MAALFAIGVDTASSAETRFTIRERIGYITFARPFTGSPAISRHFTRSFAGFIRTELFWMAFTILNTLVLSVHCRS